MTRFASIISFFLVILSSCGYHITHYDKRINKTIYVGDVINDRSGLLKEALVKSLACDVSWSLDNKEPLYFLTCKIIDESSDQIGFRYDRYEPTSNIINRLIPIEARKKIKSEVFIKNTENNSVLGPFFLEGSADFDYVNFDTYKDLAFTDHQGNPQATLNYSLGQLDACDGAEEAATLKCYQNLGSKILDLLKNL